jgi:hypothetical protein
LHQQALDARVDQPGAELGEIENADDECEQPGDVEKDDAPAEARKRDPDEEIPALLQQGREPSPRLLERGLIFAGPFRLDFGRKAFRRSIEHGGRSAGCAPPLKTPPAFLGDQVLERSSSWAFQFLDDPSSSASGLRRPDP